MSRIDSGTTAVVDTIPVGNGPSGIATGAGAVWVVNSLDGTVSRIDPGTNTVVQTIGVGGGPRGIVYAAGSVWVANTGDGTITRIDPESGRPTEPLQVAATELAFGAGTLWASQRAAGQVVRIDPTTGKQVFAPIHVGNGPTGIAFGHGAAWVANSLDGTVSRIDPETNSVTATVPTGNGPDAVAVDPRGIWVSNQFDGNVVRIDPGRNQVAQRVSVGSRPSGLAMSGDAVLVAVRHSGAGHRGGTLVLRTNRPRRKGSDSIDSIDYALSRYTYVLPLLRMTGDGLTAFNQVSGLAGTQLVPDLATSLPAPTDGGRTYTFQLRPGIRYSNGRPVQATDFRSTFERFYALGSPATDYDGIVGGAQCRKHPKRCDLSRGIVADDVARTVTFHLTRPDPDFLYKLAFPFAYVLPGGTPRRPAGTHPLPATGPYMIATYRPRRLLRFVRNPFFHEWSRAAQPDGYPDRIDIRIAGTADEAIRDVVDGKADVVWLAQPLTPSQAVEARAPVREPDPLRPEVGTSRRSSSTLASRPSTGSTPVGRSTSPSTAPRRRTPGAGRTSPSRRARSCRRTSPATAPTARTRPARRSSGNVDGTRPGEGEGARRTLRDARHEGHRLGVVAGKGLQPGGREGAALARLPRGREAGRRRPILGCRR